jgi:hypothetical protein
VCKVILSGQQVSSHDLRQVCYLNKLCCQCMPCQCPEFDISAIDFIKFGLVTSLYSSRTS